MDTSATEDGGAGRSVAAEVVEAWLRERHAAERLSRDARLRDGLDLDSLAWVDLALTLREQAGLQFDEAWIAQAETLGDLLDDVSQAGPAVPGDLIAAPEAWLSIAQRALLRRPRRAEALLAHTLMLLDALVWRSVFRLGVRGAHHVPRTGACLLAPTHTSYLDGLTIVAALGARRAARLYWSGWAGLMFRSRPMRLFSRLFHVVPVNAEREPLSSLALAAAVLARGDCLVWFPEGRRALDGALRPLQPGIGWLLARREVPVVPVCIQGTYEALPPGARLPRPRRIRIVFGEPVAAATLAAEGAGRSTEARIGSALHARLRALADSMGRR